MTMRVEVSILPYGSEKGKYELFRLDISNIGLVRNEGFGHEICKYFVKVYQHNNAVMREQYNLPEWEWLMEDVVEEHDRRDGSIALVAKAAKLVEERV